MICKGFVSLLTLLASWPLSYAATRDTGDEALPVNAVNITSPPRDGHAWVLGQPVVVLWDTTITSPTFWAALSVVNNDQHVELGYVLVKTGRFALIAQDMEAGEFWTEMRPLHPVFKDIVWRGPTFIVVPSNSVTPDFRTYE